MTRERAADGLPRLRMHAPACGWAGLLTPGAIVCSGQCCPGVAWCEHALAMYASSAEQAHLLERLVIQGPPPPPRLRPGVLEGRCLRVRGSAVLRQQPGCPPASAAGPACCPGRLQEATRPRPDGLQPGPGRGLRALAGELLAAVEPASTGSTWSVTLRACLEVMSSTLELLSVATVCLALSHCQVSQACSGWLQTVWRDQQLKAGQVLQVQLQVRVGARPR